MLLNITNLIFTAILFVGGASDSNVSEAEKRTSREEYLDKYKMVAVQDMLITGVPASITMAQAVLESDNGNSPLATNANNHFGIKCHDWKGDRYYHDDDAKQECFRKYGSTLESFDDHSYFLKNRARYSFLFEIPRTDYKAWAHGLKKAGYATNPIYAEKLIEIIERYNLQDLDKIDKMPKLDKIEKGQEIADKKSDKTISVTSKSVQFNNGIKYVVVQKGETYDDIVKENDVRMWQIIKYNDLPKSSAAKAGQRIYLQPKRNKCREEFHVLQAGESMYTVSQRYGMRLKVLYKRNRMKPGEATKPGQKLWLKHKRKKTD